MAYSLQLFENYRIFISGIEYALVVLIVFRIKNMITISDVFTALQL